MEDELVDLLLARDVDIPDVHLLPGQVTDVSSWPPQIRVGASETDAPCPTIFGYTPFVDDVVLVLTAGATRICLGTVREVTWTAVTFQNSWVNFGGVWQNVEYRKIGDMVQLRGLMKNGTLDATAFTLPVGYRTPAALGFPVMEAPTNSTGRLDISTDGTCVPRPDPNTPTGAGTNVHFGVNCQFSVSP